MHCFSYSPFRFLDRAVRVDNIKITAHDPAYSVNTSYFISYYYSKYTKILPYTWADELFFIGTSNNSKNISAYGQTRIVPGFNITGISYDSPGINYTLYTDNTYACVDISAGTNDTKLILYNFTSPKKSLNFKNIRKSRA